MTKMKTPLQLVKKNPNGGFEYIDGVAEKVFSDPSVSGLKVIVLCIAGASRKGKSFLLNIILNYLQFMEESLNGEYRLNKQTIRNAFTVRGGCDATTMGIWIWHKAFVVKNSKGEKFAVALMDSQGIFDGQTTFKDNSTLFGMSSLFSSIMCFNIMQDIQEDTINNFAAFLDHASGVYDNLGGTGKLFQNLTFILRDFVHRQFLSAENGGEMYMSKIFDEYNRPQDLQATRKQLNQCFEQRNCYLISHPGDSVAGGEFDGTFFDVKLEFVQQIQNMLSKLLNPNSMKPKKIGPTEMKASDMPQYLKLCSKTFANNQGMAPEAIHLVNRAYMINLEGCKCLEFYKKMMQEFLKRNPKGIERMPFFKLHEIAKETTVKEPTQRIKDRNVLAEITSKANEKIDEYFMECRRSNNTLLEKEQQRIKHEADKKKKAAEYSAEIKRREEEAKRIIKENEREKAKLKADAERKEAELRREAERERERAKDAERRMEQAAERERQRRRDEDDMRRRRENERNNGDVSLGVINNGGICRGPPILTTKPTFDFPPPSESCKSWIEMNSDVQRNYGTAAAVGTAVVTAPVMVVAHTVESTVNAVTAPFKALGSLFK